MTSRATPPLHRTSPRIQIPGPTIATRLLDHGMLIDLYKANVVASRKKPRSKHRPTDRCDGREQRDCRWISAPRRSRHRSSRRKTTIVVVNVNNAGQHKKACSGHQRRFTALNSWLGKKTKPAHRSAPRLPAHTAVRSVPNQITKNRLVGPPDVAPQTLMDTTGLTQASTPAPCSSELPEAPACSADACRKASQPLTACAALA